MNFYVTLTVGILQIHNACVFVGMSVDLIWEFVVLTLVLVTWNGVSYLTRSFMKTQIVVFAVAVVVVVYAVLVIPWIGYIKLPRS